MATDATVIAGTEAEPKLKVRRKSWTPGPKQYIWQHIVRVDDVVANHPAAEKYLGKLVAGVFDSPAVRHAWLWKDPTVAATGKGRETSHGIMDSPPYILTFHFETPDRDKVKAMIEQKYNEVAAAIPMPAFIKMERDHVWALNHHIERHEDYARPLADYPSPSGKKWISYGFSRPARDANDLKMQVKYIDWYQEVRQHDVLRGYFGYENAFMYLIEEDEDWDWYVFTYYELTTDNPAMLLNITLGAYAVIEVTPGHDSDLYHPKYEGLLEVLAEHAKEY